MTERVVIFLHLPKAAGSTLNRVIAQQYPPSAICKISGNPSAEVTREITEGTREGGPIRIITGHTSFGTHALVARPFTYITVLRDPVERLLSHYYFARGLPSHPLHAEIMSGALTLTKAAQRLANMQTRYLADEAVRGKVGSTGRGALASAQENLSRHFSVAGVAEHFDATLVLLERRLGWKIRPVANSNVNRGRPDHTAHTEEELAAIREANGLDIELYAWVRERFEAERAGLGVRAAVGWLRLRTRAAGLRQKLASLRAGAAR